VKHTRLVAAVTLLAACSLPLIGQDGRSKGGVLAMSYSEALTKADAVAVILIDAAGYPSVIHGKVTSSIKGIEVGTDLCVTLVSHPAVGEESLFFLSRTSAPAAGNRISSCGPSATFFSLPDPAAQPLPIVYTWEVLPCVKQPCARTVFCPNPPCVRMAKSVRLFSSEFPEIPHRFPAFYPDAHGDTWFYEAEHSRP
jgi:hypothetical protein